MLKYSHIFFDMDGTVLESGPGVKKAVSFALEKLGIKETEDKNLRRFIGPPLKDSFKDFYGFSEEQCTKALLYFRDYYEKQNGLFDSYIYDGIPELLKKLKDEGAHLYIASSKPEIYIHQLLKRDNLDKYFDCVGGADVQEIRVKKEDIIQYVIDECKLSEEIKSSNVIMVGDRKFDIEGAAIFGIKTIGVLYGYGSREELDSHGAIATAKDCEELFELLKK